MPRRLHMRKARLGGAVCADARGMEAARPERSTQEPHSRSSYVLLDSCESIRYNLVRHGATGICLISLTLKARSISNSMGLTIMAGRTRFATAD